MKIGRNDPCPCGSGKKYKHCCLNKEKIIPFPESRVYSDNKTLTDIQGGFPPVYKLMGFDTLKDYEAAMEEYQYYCENILKDGDKAPTFREYFHKNSDLGNFLEEMDFEGKLENAGSLEEAEKIIGELVQEYNEGVEDDEEDRYMYILDELAYHGPLKADDIVHFNKKIPIRVLRETPVMQMALSFLEYLVRNNGKVGNFEDGPDEKDISVLFEILEQYPNIDLQARDSKGRLLISLWYDFVKIVLFDKKYIAYNTSLIRITEKGIKMFGSKGTRAFYFQFLQFITEKLNWFYRSSLPESVVELQNLTGVSMLFMNSVCREYKYVAPEPLLNMIDRFFKVKDTMQKQGVTEKQAVQLYTDYFMEGYCRLMGFVDPVSLEPKDAVAVGGKTYRKVYEPAKLFYEMFEWLI